MPVGGNPRLSPQHQEEAQAPEVAPEAPARAPLRMGTTESVLWLQRTAGNAAVQAYLARQPTTAPPPQASGAATGSPAEAAVRAILGSGPREPIFSACLAAGKQWDAAVTAFGATHDPAPSLQEAAQRTLGTADAARAWAYLRYGTLRLADKLYVAGIGSGTDAESIWRLLPAVRSSYSTVEQEFTAGYGKTGSEAFSGDYADSAKLLDGSDSVIAGFLDDEFDGADLAKSMALLTFGEVRPVDELHIALESVHILSASVMAALEKVARGAGKGNVEKLYEDTYKRPLRPRLEAELGSASDKFKKAKLILAGEYTLKGRIKLACEGLGTDEDEIWAALADAGDAELKVLQDEWARGEEIKTLIVDELGGSDLERFKTVMESGTAMKGRLAQFGVDVKDIQGVIALGLERPEVQAAFKAEWAKPEGEFRRAFTSEERIGAALMWGGQLVSEDPLVRLRLALELASEKGVHRILLEGITTDEQRGKVLGDWQMNAALRRMDDWPRFEALLMPRDDLKARAEWMRQKFKNEKGLWGSTRPAQAYEDEQRELDLALKDVKDPKNMTPEERKKVGSRAAATEASLDDFIKVRDEFDQLAIQVVGGAAGLLATFLTGGAAGPVTAALLARVALTQACASAAAVWAIKQERTQAGEAARAFAVGAASGVAQTMAAGPVVKLLASPAGRTLETQSVNVATKVAGQEFQGIGYATMKGTLESAAGGAAGALVDSGSRAETWRGGFVAGLEKLVLDAAAGAAVSGAMGGAMEGIKAGLFGGKAGGSTARAGGGDGPPPVPVKLERAHVERAKMMLQSGEHLTWDYWVKALAELGDHAPIAREAFATARHELLLAAIERLEGELAAMGVKASVPPRASFDSPVELVLVPEGNGDRAAVQRALARVRQELGPGFEARSGVRTREGVAGEPVGAVKGTSTYDMATKAMTPAEFGERVNLDVVKGGGEWMVQGTTAAYKGLSGNVATVELTIPPAGTKVAVKLVAVEATALPRTGTHAGEAGPGRIELKPDAATGAWEATVHVDSMLDPKNVRHVVGHELDEIAGLVNKSATSPTGRLTLAQLAAEMEAGIFTRNPSLGAKPTVHDHAAAQELFDMWKQHRAAVAAGDAAEATRLVEQMKRHVGSMALDDPHSANDKNYLLQQHGDKSKDWRHFVDKLNAEGPAAFAHLGMSTTGQLSGGSFITPDVLAHVMFAGPQPTAGQFVKSGISGCHEESQLLHFVSNSELGYAVVADASMKAGSNTYTRYKQFRWDGPGPAPKPGSPNYPVNPAVTPPGWTAAKPFKTTAMDLGAFLKEVDDFLVARGTPLAVTETINGKTASGMDFKAYVNNGKVATVFPVM